VALDVLVHGITAHRCVTFAWSAVSQFSEQFDFSPMAEGSFLMDLCFFPAERTAAPSGSSGDAKPPPPALSLRGTILFTVGGGNFLLAAVSDGRVAKIDMKLQSQLVNVLYSTVTSICPGSANDLLTAGVRQDPPAFGVSFFNVADFDRSIESGVDYTVDSSLTLLPTCEAPSFFATSRSLAYVAFVSGNELLLFKDLQTQKKPKPHGKLPLLVPITNLLVSNEGSVYLTDTQSIKVWHAGVSVKNQAVPVAPVGIQPGLACLTPANALAIFREANLSVYRPPTEGSQYSVDSLPLSQHRTANSQLGAFSSYFFLVTEARDRITVIDPVYRITALTIRNLSPAVKAVHYVWGAVVLVHDDWTLTMRPELPPREKIERLCRQHLFAHALNMCAAAAMPDNVAADIHRKKGDLHYGQSQFDEAIAEYIETLGSLEPSYVIQKFVEPHHAERLMRYLIELQRRDRATKQHTPRLFNCYTKIGERDRLEQAVQGFVAAAERGEEPTFDVQTAVDVLKRNNFPELAENLARAYQQHSIFLQLLYETRKYREILGYLQTKLPGELILANLREYGTEIMDNSEEWKRDVTRFAVRCCTEGIANSKRYSTEHKKGPVTRLTPEDLAMMFMNESGEHFVFLREILEFDRAAFSETNWNTLIEMALRAQSDELMALLNTQKAKYSNEQALVYLTAFNHVAGKKFIYERMKLYTLILQEASAEDCEEICVRFGAEDPSLWSDALVKLARADCRPGVLESFLEKVLAHRALPFLVVLNVMKSAKKHTLKTLLPLVQATFRQEQELLHAAEDRIKRSEERVRENQEVARRLSTSNFVIQQKKCQHCHQSIDSESNHFMCGHSFHVHCLGDSKSYCPACKDDVFLPILKEKVARMSKPRDEASVKDSLARAGDGFSFLLDQVRGSLFASGVDLTRATQDTTVLSEATQLLQAMERS
jgi:tetratricopeptide (TPR) repeat protein